MTIIKYCEEGEVYSDFNYNFFVAAVKKAVNRNFTGTFAVASQICVDAVRLEVAKGNISHDKIKFKYKDEEITINDIGILSHYPRGFCDTVIEMRMAILDERFKDK